MTVISTTTRRRAVAMTIGRQVLAGYGAVLLVLLGLVLIAAAGVNTVSNTKDKVIEEHSVLVSRAYQLEAVVSEQAALHRAYYLTGDESRLAGVTELEATYHEVIAEITSLVAERERGLLGEIVAAEQTWSTEADQVVALVRSGGTPEEVAQLFSSTSGPARETLRAAIRELIDRENEVIGDQVEAADDRANRVVTTLWWLAGGALALSLAIGGWITRRVSRRLAEMSHQVDGAASDILAGTTQQVAGFSEQAAAVQQTVATVDELVQTAEQSAARAKLVAERSHQSAEVTQAGIDAVQGSADGMRTIRDQVHTIAESVVALAERAQAISDIIDAVDEIAERTHLLALNAAIEAARAGEHGRGFGVVAAEVKVLADQSRRATAQVAEILGEIQRGTNTAVMLTEAGTKSVDEGTRLVAQAGSTIEDLAETVADATVAAEQIAASSSQQAVATAQISHAMRDVDTVMEQNLAAARQSEETARALTAVAKDMKALVGAD